MLIDGKKIAQEIEQEIKSRILQFKGRKPGLAVILVGEDPASHAYVRMKKRSCTEVGIYSHVQHFPASISEKDLLTEIKHLNHNPLIDGILVQMPLPSHIDPHKVTAMLDARKDVDGFHPINMGKLLLGEPGGFVPCTPQGIKELLARSQISIEGKHVVILGRSNLVGKPLAALLMQKKPHCNATVTVAHSASKNLQELCRLADILVVAIGKPLLVTAEMVKPGAVVIDVGIHQIQDQSSKKGYRITGDVDFQTVAQKCAAITPVPGGVGPMTIAILLKNTLDSFEKKQEKKCNGN